MINKVPLLYYPPTICLIDDDQLFLDAAKSLFDKQYNCLTFNDPREALDYLNRYTAPLDKINFTRDFIESDIYDTYNHRPIDINISEIVQLYSIAQKYNEIAVIVIDNNMPNLNGLELCKNLNKSSFKKILLTGQADPGDIIEAFNKGLIDKFIRKDQLIVEDLQRTIYDLSYQYFNEKTQHLISHLEASRPTLLSDPAFISFFNKWRNEANIIEYYLINKHGSFLVKDAQGAEKYFIIMSEQDKNAFIKLNDDALDKIGHLLDRMHMGEVIPFFGINKECWEFDYEVWDNYFYPCDVIEGREKYYWTIIKMEGKYVV